VHHTAATPTSTTIATAGRFILLSYTTGRRLAPALADQLQQRYRTRTRPTLPPTREILTTAWSGAPVHNRGRHYTIDGIQFLPRLVQQPGVPVWVAGFPGNLKPLRRAARHDGFFPANLEHPDQLAEIVATITDLRQHTTAPYDIAVGLPPGTDLREQAISALAYLLIAQFEREAQRRDPDAEDRGRVIDDGLMQEGAP
jgi:alkanesulfonate monooxygenase SsuD/methylene tetrahydromethanopterin reductase-like flavin-dependent oxidoreductase (luciferase family)